MKGTISTPNIGFKKLLLKRFEMFEINEYNTSKLYNKTFKELENISVRKNKHKKHLHEILTPKEKTVLRLIHILYIKCGINLSTRVFVLINFYIYKS